jgi:hypothetical protein
MKNKVGALQNSSFEKPQSKNYFLAVLSFMPEIHCAAIIRTTIERESKSA